MVKVTALVHTYNAELYLEECLKALRSFDEILICDMYSTDRTLEIAEAAGARIIFHENVGFADPARDWAIKQAKNEWVLVIDADEVITDDLRLFVNEFLNSNNGRYSAARIPVVEYFMGKPMRCNYPNHVTRLLHRDKTTWPPTVHTQPIVDGELYVIPKSQKILAIKHYSNPDISCLISKLNTYTTKEVDRKINRGIKYSSFLITCFRAGLRFFKAYIIKGGIWDGKAGFVFCKLETFYIFIVLFKIWEEKVKLSK